MTARRIVHILALLLLIITAPACEEVEYVDRVQYQDNPNQTYPGKECDWKVPNDTEKEEGGTLGGCIDPGLVCGPTVVNGTLLPNGRCSHALGIECTETAALYPIFDDCNRGLRCQPYEATERNDFRCLPKRCINHKECASGESCQNHQCVMNEGTCGA